MKGGNLKDGLWMERSWPLCRTPDPSQFYALALQALALNPSPGPRSKRADLQPPEGLGPDELEDWELKNLPCKEMLRRLDRGTRKEAYGLVT